MSREPYFHRPGGGGGGVGGGGSIGRASPFGSGGYGFDSQQDHT